MENLKFLAEPLALHNYSHSSFFSDTQSASLFLIVHMNQRMCGRLFWIVCVRIWVCASVGSVLGNVSRVMQWVSHSLPSSAQQTESHNHEAQPWTDSWNVKLPRPKLPTPTYWEHTYKCSTPHLLFSPPPAAAGGTTVTGKKKWRQRVKGWATGETEQLINKWCSGSGHFLGNGITMSAALNSLGSSLLKNSDIRL